MVHLSSTKKMFFGFALLCSQISTTQAGILDSIQAHPKVATAAVVGVSSFVWNITKACYSAPWEWFYTKTHNYPDLVKAMVFNNEGLLAAAKKPPLTGKDTLNFAIQSALKDSAAALIFVSVYLSIAR